MILATVVLGLIVIGVLLWLWLRPDDEAPTEPEALVSDGGDRFTVVRHTRDAKVLAFQGDGGAKARDAFFGSMKVRGVERVEFWDNGALRSEWERD